MKSKLYYLLKVLNEIESKNYPYLTIEQIESKTKHFRYSDEFLMLAERQHWISISSRGVGSAGQMEKIYCIQPLGIERLFDISTQSSTRKWAIRGFVIGVVAILVSITLFVIGQILTGL
jgi:hypothetical protein